MLVFVLLHFIEHNRQYQYLHYVRRCGAICLWTADIEFLQHCVKRGDQRVTHDKQLRRPFQSTANSLLIHGASGANGWTAAQGASNRSAILDPGDEFVKAALKRYLAYPTSVQVDPVESVY